MSASPGAADPHRAASPHPSAPVPPAPSAAVDAVVAAGALQASRVGGRGAVTRRAAQQVALELFTAQGYEATSLRQIADRLGINKASLYYYFSGKEAIVQSLFDERGTEAEELLAWLREQPRTPELMAEAVLRWVDTFTADKLRGIRFLAANPLLAQTLANPSDAEGQRGEVAGGTGSGEPGRRIGDALSRFADELVGVLPDRGGSQALLVRMAVLSVNAAVHAAAGTGARDDAIIEAARRAARALVGEVAG